MWESCKYESICAGMGAASIAAAHHVVADGDSGEERREVMLECEMKERAKEVARKIKTKH